MLHSHDTFQERLCCINFTGISSTWANTLFNTLRLIQNGRHFADNIFKCIFFNENVWISIKISLKFLPKGPINKIPTLFQIMAWRRPGDKPLSEAILVSLLTHKCVTRPQWVKAVPSVNIIISAILWDQVQLFTSSREYLYIYHNRVHKMKGDKQIYSMVWCKGYKNVITEHISKAVTCSVMWTMA